MGECKPFIEIFGLVVSNSFLLYLIVYRIWGSYKQNDAVLLI